MVIRCVTGSLIRPLVVAFILGAVPLFATPFSQRGMIEIPTAYILPHTRGLGAASVYAPWPNGVTGDFIGYMGIYNKAEIGTALPIIYSNDELGVSAFNMRWYFHGKYQVFSESRMFPAMAVGMMNIGADGDLVDGGELVPDGAGFVKDYQANSLYFVLSKQMLIRPVYDRLIYTDFHLGMGVRRFVGDTYISRTFHGIFAGLDIYLNRHTNLMFEQDGNDFNIGVQYAVSDLLTLRGAWVKIEELMTEETPFPNLGFGIQYMVGPFQGKQKKVVKLYSTDDRRAFLMKGAVDIHEDTLKLIIQMNKLKKQRETLETKLKGLKNAVEELRNQRSK